MQLAACTLPTNLQTAIYVSTNSDRSTSTHIGPGSEGSVASTAGLEDLGGDTQSPQGTHQLLVDLRTTGTADSSTHLGQVTQGLAACIVGNTGVPGIHGRHSRGGRQGEAGGILWVLNSGGRVLNSSTRYDAQVTSLVMEPLLDDGVFEPNEAICVACVVVENTGGLDLPSGAIARIPSTETIVFEQSSFTLPTISAGHTYTIPFRFHGRIRDVHPPITPGCQSIKRLKANFHTRIELLGRPFMNSCFRKEVEVQYPLQFGSLSCSQNLDGGETGLISIEVRNVSTLPYGSCKGSNGRVVLRLHLDSRLNPTAAQADKCCKVLLTHNPNIPDSTLVELHQVPPKQTLMVDIKITMVNQARLLDECFWQASLYLRDKLIEYNQQSIKVTPMYSSLKPPADVLLVTSGAMSHNELVFWLNIFCMFNASVDIWDTDYYCGFSVDSRTGMRHSNSWFGRYSGKLIVFPYYDPKLFSGIDMAQHFHGDNFRQMPLKELNSSLVVFTSQPLVSEMLKHLAKVHPRLDVPDDAYGGYHVLNPPNQYELPILCSHCEEKIIKKLEEKNLTQAPLVLGREINLQYLHLFSFSYGTIDVRYLPILKSSKFLAVDRVRHSSDLRTLTTAAIIQLNNAHGQAILAVLFGLSISVKLSLIKPQPLRSSSLNDLAFVLADGSVLCKAEVAMVILASEVADELFTCSGEVHRMQEIYDDITGNIQAYLECGRIVLRGLKLIEQEFHKRRLAGLKHFRVMQAHGKISNMSKSIQRILVDAGVNNSKLENLPSLDQLENGTAHRYHQQYVADYQPNNHL